MAALKNIGKDERNMHTFGVRIAPGKAAPIGNGQGQVPEAIARELVGDDPTNWAIEPDKATEPKAAKA